MPILWQWRCADADQLDRLAMHRALSWWLDDDHRAKHKPWSWAVLPAAADGGVHLQIGVVDDRLSERLLAGAGAVSRSGRLGGLVVEGQPRQVAGAAWSQLMGTGSVSAWELRFRTPVTFRRGGKFLPWPSPSAVFGSLRTTWREFGATHVGDLVLDLSLDPLVVCALNGASRTERVVVHDRGPDATTVTVGGFVGTVRYAVDGRVEPAVVNALVGLAAYSGVGAYTTRGFGCVQPCSG